VLQIIDIGKFTHETVELDLILNAFLPQVLVLFLHFMAFVSANERKFERRFSKVPLSFLVSLIPQST
jgi:hypothetical protein